MQAKDQHHWTFRMGYLMEDCEYYTHHKIRNHSYQDSVLTGNPAHN